MRRRPGIFRVPVVQCKLLSRCWVSPPTPWIPSRVRRNTCVSHNSQTLECRCVLRQRGFRRTLFQSHLPRLVVQHIPESAAAYEVRRPQNKKGTFNLVASSKDSLELHSAAQDHHRMMCRARSSPLPQEARPSVALESTGVVGGHGGWPSRANFGASRQTTFQVSLVLERGT